MACKIDVDKTIISVIQRRVKNITVITDFNASPTFNFGQEDIKEIKKLNQEFGEKVINYIPPFETGDESGSIRIKISEALYNKYIKAIDKKRGETSLKQERDLSFFNNDQALFEQEERDSNIMFTRQSPGSVQYSLKAINILSSTKAIETFAKGEKAGWSLDKILTELQIPKEQKQLILDLGVTNREDIITDLLANYSYTIEINTAKIKEERNFGEFGQLLLTEGQIVRVKGYDGLWKTIGDGGTVYNQEDFIPSTKWDLQPLENEFDPETNPDGLYPLFDVPESYITIDNNYRNTQHYSNLTVPGGTNYTENEIATPAITPSIKGHAQFATPNGIGWFRSDESQQYQETDVQNIIDNLQKSGQLEINCK